MLLSPAISPQTWWQTDRLTHRQTHRQTEWLGEKHSTFFQRYNDKHLNARLRNALKSNVVYQYICSCDINNSYIGKTKRHLITRVTEHRTDKSAIGQHLSSRSSCRNSFGIYQFKNISNGRTDVECKIKEALNIKNINPTLNQNLFQHGSSFLINDFR